MGASLQILLATYNGERYVATQLESLLVQDFTDFEVLVSDDRSSDATLEIVQRYAEADTRIRVLDNDVRHGNARDNFFSLLKRAAAPYVAFCDQDDLWLPDKLAVEMAEMHRLEIAYGADAPLLVYSDLAVASEDLSIIAPSLLAYSGADPHRLSLANLMSQNTAAGCSIVVNRPLYRDTMRLPANVDGVGMHDWWMMVTAAAFGHIGYVDQPTSLYRQHGDNSVGASSGSPLDIVRNLGAYASALLPNEQQLGAIEMRVRQAGAFAEAYDGQLSERDQELCEGLSRLLDLPPLARLRWCHNHDVRNATPIMRLGMAWEMALYDQGRARLAHEQAERES
jgi:hypothetical protein